MKKIKDIFIKKNELRNDMLKDGMNIPYIRRIIKSLFKTKDKKIISIINNMNFKNKKVEETDICGDIKGKVLVLYFNERKECVVTFFLYEKFVKILMEHYTMETKKYIFEIEEKLDLSKYKEELESNLFFYNGTLRVV